jgi:hypothetical protein
VGAKVLLGKCVGVELVGLAAEPSAAAGQDVDDVGDGERLRDVLLDDEQARALVDQEAQELETSSSMTTGAWDM